MKKLFGTDGIRGKANAYPITPEIALKTGMALACYYKRKYHGKKLTAVLGHDTRVSSFMLQKAIVSGFFSLGVDVYIVGIMPTPEVAFLTKDLNADFGVMITASHNPPCDNGIKIFNSDGYKLSDDVEMKIEELIFENDFTSEMVPGDQVGRIVSNEKNTDNRRYMQFAKKVIKNIPLSDYKIVLDCANGAASKIGPELFMNLGVDLIAVGTETDGKNINVNCGATYPEKISKLVKEFRADLGISFDGDADRVIFCDSDGNIVNGDRIIAICALDYKKRNLLKGNAVVVTAMTNLGFHEAMKKFGIQVIVSEIGDRYVIEEMRKNDCNIGGEQSGHIIFLDHGTTGDGIITALHILEIMEKENKSLKELADCMNEFPQELKNYTVKEKIPLEQCPVISKEIENCMSALGSEGRILIRYSGTESKIRVLIEAKHESDVKYWSDRIGQAIREELAPWK
jgi:phosphoglucosamine mutase